MKNFYLLFFLLLAFCTAKSQNRSTIVKCLILDQNQNPINDVYLLDADNNSLLGVSYEGLIIFNTSRNNLNLKSSHIAYQKKFIQVNDLLAKDSIELKINLEDKSFGLDVVSIRAEQTNLAYLKEKVNIEDYQFYNSTMVLLCGIGNNKELRLASSTGHDIHRISLPKKAKSLFRDCFNNIHVVNKDSVYQIKFTDTSFYLLPPYPKHSFDKTLGLCEASSNFNLILGHEGPFNQEIRYFIKYKNEDNYRFFRRIVNRIDQRKAMALEGQFQNLSEKGINSGSATTWQGLAGVRAIDRQYVFFKHVMSKPIYAPIFEMDGQFVLFDHQLDSILFYESSGQLKKAISINYHFEESWGNQLLKDYSSNKVYAYMKNGPKKWFYPINLSTGETGRRISLEKHYISDNYKVKDGYLYYLYREKSQGGLPNKLYKQKL